MIFHIFLVHLNKWATYHVNLLSAILLWICNVVWIINKIIYKYISSFILIISSLQLSFFLFDFAVTLYTFSLLLRNHFSHYLIHACKHFSGYSLRGHFLNRSYLFYYYVRHSLLLRVTGFEMFTSSRLIVHIKQRSFQSISFHYSKMVPPKIWKTFEWEQSWRSFPVCRINRQLSPRWLFLSHVRG